MAESNTRNSPNSSDEIDLGQLFQLIGKGFNRLFHVFLKLFLYFKKNALIFLGLIVLGVAVGFGLNQITTKKVKMEVIVKPNMESKNYLYDVINEIQAIIKAKDTAFFSNIGVELTDFDGLEVAIATVNENKESSKGEIKYLELLQSFENTEAIADIVRAELQNKSSFNHRITFFYKDTKVGEQFAQGVMEYINSNEYFDGLIAVYRENATSRIKENKQLLKQMDEIITSYTKKMGEDNGMVGNDRIVLDNQETVNITGLFDLKNILIQDIESKNLELEQRTDPIKIINFGRPQEVQKALFGKKIVLLPLILMGTYLFGTILMFLNKKAKELG
jgi:serine/threonine protein kinase